MNDINLLPYAQFLGLFLFALFIVGLFIRFRKYGPDSDPKGLRFPLTYVEFFLTLLFLAELGHLFGDCERTQSCSATAAALLILPIPAVILSLLGIVLLVFMRRTRTWRVSDTIRAVLYFLPALLLGSAFLYFSFF